MQNTEIEYLDDTWNYMAGCDAFKLSPGCLNCYGERVAGKFQNVFGSITKDDHWTGEVKIFTRRLHWPTSTRAPRWIGVCFMGDLFCKAMPDEAINDVLTEITSAFWHTFILLTKRVDRALQVCSSFASGNSKLNGKLPRNLFIGASVENQQQADIRVPLLQAIPAHHHMISVEPLLGSVNLRPWMGEEKFIHWIVGGGETGRGARPCNPLDVIDLRDQCRDAGVPFLWKQWGEFVVPQFAINPEQEIDTSYLYNRKTGKPLVPYADLPNGLRAFRLGRKQTGREVQGVEILQYPPEKARIEAQMAKGQKELKF